MIIKTLFKKEYVEKLWSNGNTMPIEKKNFSVHKMSYGKYFLEPEGYKGGETDVFSADTIWLCTKKINNELFYTFDKLYN